MHNWHKALLYRAVPPLIRKWELKLGVEGERLFSSAYEDQVGELQSPRRPHPPQHGAVKKPKDLLEYVIVHEMAHMLEPTHSERFVAILDQHYASWREARSELNELPLAAEKWNEARECNVT
jgi:predicted metal-dependent hydrolase